MPAQAPNDPNLTCRLLRPDDAAALGTLFDSFRAHGFDKFFHPHPLTTEEAANLARYTGKDAYAVLVDGSRIIGYGMLRGWDAGYDIPSFGVAIDPTAQSRGHGRRLLEFLQQIARERGAKKIRLKVYPDNQRAVRFYREYGYEFESTLDNGQLVGYFDLTRSTSKPLNLGILAHDFMEWSGGVDFLWMITNALLATDRGQKSNFHLLVPDSGLRLGWRKTRKKLKAAMSGKSIPAGRDSSREICSAFSTFGNRVTIQHIDIGKKAIERAISDLDLDIVFPALHSLGKDFPKPWLAYAYDFQHKYFPQYFSPDSCRSRDEHFADILTQAKAVIVNSKAAADDIAKFVPQATARVYSLPFSAAPAPEWLEPATISPQNQVDSHYFIISNQFWVHKDHGTAFKAFEKIAAEFPNVSLVCTGSTSGSSDANYYPALLQQIKTAGLDGRIKMLGLIPKREQIELLKNARAVVQPTLFEGGPGGGSVYEAVALGVPSIVSDIPVNQELQGLNVTLFKVGDADALATKMRETLRTTYSRPNAQALIDAGNKRRLACAEMLWDALDFSR
jgi:glycosyltransferase involved in cell wall biosynthesis